MVDSDSEISDSGIGIENKNFNGSTSALNKYFINWLNFKF